VIGLVSCAATKRKVPSIARRLYVSPLFARSLEYAERRCMSTYILSALYGLLDTERFVEPYDRRLTTKADRNRWGSMVVNDLLRAEQGRYDDVMILAGEDYAAPIRAALREVNWSGEVLEPLRGKQIGERLAWLADELAAMPLQLPAPGPESVARARWFVGDERDGGCSFCGAKAGRMCSGPGAAICEGCVELCRDVFATEAA
jgi:hypothetical protein